MRVWVHGRKMTRAASLSVPGKGPHREVDGSTSARDHNPATAEPQLISVDRHSRCEPSVPSIELGAQPLDCAPQIVCRATGQDVQNIIQRGLR